MKVTQITYAKLENLGNYEHQRIEVSVQLDDGDTPHVAIQRAKDWVAKEMDLLNLTKKIDIENLRNTLDKLDADIPF